ncbi:MAG: hypothetical protein AAF960_02445 [Bacteroidota bacterium]
MKFLQISMLIAAIGFSTSFLTAQSNIKTYAFKKGEILDILLITSKPNYEPLFEEYKKTAFPIAMKMGFQPLPGYRITESTQGNHEPSSFILGKWNDLTNREKFIADIEKLVPDFHEQRRAIWSIFDLTYYEMPTDVSFQIDKSKFNVATAYWGKDIGAFKKFKKSWLTKSKKMGGQEIIKLEDGKSPFGYYYQPDFLVITEWETRADFEKFHRENMGMNHTGVQHVNQFILQ